MHSTNKDFAVHEKPFFPARALAFALFCFLPGFASCAPRTTLQAVVHEPPRGPVSGCFYEGLLARRDGRASEALALFEGALGDPNRYVAAAAAAELIGWRLSDGIEPSPGAWEAVGAAAVGSWAAAFDLLENAENPAGRDRALDLLLSRSTDVAVLRGVRDWHRRRVLAGDAPAGLAFSGAELAAVDGRVAASRSRWADALSFFRVAINASPGIFFERPDLLGDLGRAFQFTAASGREGIDLFLEWEAMAERAAGGRDVSWRGHDFPPGGLFAEGDESFVRFQLPFFAGRIARQRGLPDRAFFRRSLPFAKEVSTVQSDAAIWYILRSAVDQGTDVKIAYLERYVGYWANDPGFFDVMDRLSRQLILDWRWDQMMRVFGAVRSRESAITAKFAWIIARAIQEGFIPRALAAETLGLPAADPVTALMRIAFDSSGRSLYYRLMSAIFLGEEFIAVPGAEGADAPSDTDAARFLLGFFEHGAGDFAMARVRAMEAGLSLEEVRAVSEALAAAGNHLDSIIMYTRFVRRENFHFSQLTRRDWELWYPRPFWDLIERCARREGIEPALMLALIRAESAFMPEIVSHAGAVGLAQLMPPTATMTADLIRRNGGPDFRLETGGVAGTNLDLNNPSVNVHIGTVYLRILKERFGDPMLALFSYNAGTGRVRGWLNGNLQTLGFNLPIDVFLETVPFAETRNYGRNVTAAAEIYRKLYFR